MTGDEVGRLADKTAWLSLQLAETTTQLTVAIWYGWLSAWVEGYQAAGRAVDQRVQRQARTSRLIKQGVPPDAAMQDLQVV